MKNRNLLLSIFGIVIFMCLSIGGTNAQPVITSFSPVAGNVGSTITFNGSGFNATAANNIVYFGATKAVVTSSSSTSLQATVPVGATFQPVSLLNTSNHLAAFSDAEFLPTFSPDKGVIISKDFMSPVSFSAGNPFGNVIGDIDGDGKPDIIVANSTSNTISIFRNTSSSGSITSASFAAPVSFVTGSGPQCIVLSDIDGDGKPDIIVTNSNSNTISVFRNNSTVGTITSGSLAPAQNFVTGSYPTFLAAGDIDGDGKPDLVVVNGGGGSTNTISVFHNTSSSGSITSGSLALPINFTTGSNPQLVAIGDIDGDEKADIVVSNFSSNTISIFWNTSVSGVINNGSLAPKVDFITGSGPIAVAIADIDGDSKADLLVTNWSGNTLSVFRNTSVSGVINSSSLAAKVDFITRNGSSSMAIGDLNGDGKPDVVLNSNLSDTITVFRNTSVIGAINSNSFAPKVDVLTNAIAPDNLAVGDIDGDGKPDITFVDISGNNLFVIRNNPQFTPVITSFTPANGLAGGTTVNITGANFNTTPANNIVYFGPTRATVSAATSTSMTVTAPYGATYGTISALNASNNLQGASTEFFLPTFSPNKNAITNLDIMPAVSFATGTDAYSVAIGDIDGDGKPDLVVANEASNTISVFRNKSSSGTITSGSFAAPVNFATGSAPFAVTIGDLDGDGKLDIAVVNAGSNTVSVFLNTATSGSITSGSLAAKVDFNTGNFPVAVAIADVDGDGKPELLVTNHSSFTLSVLQNTSTSGSITTSSFAAKVDFTTGSDPGAIAVGDIDGDGKPDIAVTNFFSNTISIFHNTASIGYITSGSLAAKVDFTTGSSPASVAMVDIDGDGKLDLAVANQGSNTVSVFRNTSSTGSITTASLAAKVDFATESTPTSVAAGDINGDGKPDLVVANEGANTVSVLRNTSSAGSINSSSLAAQVYFNAGGAAYAVTVGDMDGDGRPDIVVANNASNTVSVLRNNPQIIPAITSFTPAEGPTGTSTVNITGTNFNPVAANNILFFGATKATVSAATATSITATVPTGATYQPINELNTFQNLQGASLQPFLPVFSPGKSAITAADILPKVDFATNTPHSVAIGDLDGDGKPDMVVANSGTNTVSVFHNTSSSGSITSGSFTDIGGFTAGNKPYGVAIADINGDGKPDVIVTNSSDNTITVYISSGNITYFTNQYTFATGTTPVSVAVGDLNGDGKPDLIVTNWSSGTVSVLLNTTIPGGAAAPTFATHADYTTGSAPYSVAIADLDGDGLLDLAVANYSANTISVLRNTTLNGSFSVATQITFATGAGPQSVVIGDIDGDGKQDLIVANQGANTVSIHHNNSSVGTMAFSGAVGFVTGNGPQAVAIADIDGDGKPDLAVTNEVDNTVSIFRNTSTIGSITTGSLSAQVIFTTGTSPWALAIGDIDGDGKPDLVVANNGASTVSVLRNNPQFIPTITSFTPTGGPTGTSTVNITGTNFNPVAANNIVFFGATKATVSAATANSITATVPTSATYQPINELNTAQNLQGASAQPFLPTFSPSKDNISPVDFMSPVNFTADSNPFYVAIADIDGDGKPDLVVAKSWSNNISVFRNTSSSGSITSGSFAAAVNFTTGTAPIAIGIADLDGDGKPDIAVVNLSSNTVSIFRNTSTSGSITAGSLSARVDFTTGNQPQAIAIADIDGDGKPDIVVANYGSSTVSVFRNNSTRGSIISSSFSGKIDFTTSTLPLSLVVGDIDGDGKADVIAACNSDTLSVLHNTSVPGIINGSSLNPAVNFAIPRNPRSVALGDMDQDGKLDIVVASWPDSISILRNTSVAGSISSGSFAPRVDFLTGNSPNSVAIADLDGDGKPDIVTSNGVGNISVLRNTASGSINSGSLATEVVFPLTGTPTSVAIGDIDGDGKPDIVVANGTTNVTVLRNNPQFIPTITSFTPTGGPTGTSTVNITGTNFNTIPANNIVHFGATKASVSAASSTSMTVTVPLGATYQPISELNTYQNLQGFSRLPFVSTFSPGSNNITASDFQSQVNFNADLNPSSVEIGDVDGDGKPDLIVSNWYSNTISIFRNTSIAGTINTSSLAAKVDFATGNTPWQVVVADIDGDGKSDLVVVNQGSGTVSVFRNISASGSITASSFAARVDFTVGSSPYSVAVADVDGDGKPDLIASNSGNNTISVLRNTSIIGTITMAGQLTFSTGNSPWQVAVADIDGDGKPDVVVANETGNSVSVLRNISTTNTINFAAHLDFATGTTPGAVAVGDIDGDGKPDLMVANYGSSSVSVLRNSSTSGVVSLAAQVSFATGATPNAIAIGDLNGDGKPDLAITSYFNTSVVTLLPNTSSTGLINSNSFASALTLTAGNDPSGVAIGDIDGDGKPDVVVANQVSNNISILRNSPVPDITTGLINGSICTGSAITVPFSVDFAANNGNVFTAQLSNASGSFVTPVSIGNLTGTTGGSIAATIPAGTSAGTGYRIRVISNNPADTGSDNGTDISINISVTPAVSISANPAGTICSGVNVKFTAVPTNPGTSPIYNFMINDSSVQNGSSASYNNTALNNNDVITCAMISSAVCANPDTVNSNNITMLVNPVLVPSVNLTASQSGICTGTAVTFTASADNGGSTPNYNFKVNGASVQNGTSSTYTSSILNNGDAVTCVLTSNASCANPSVATSNSITMLVGTVLTPAVSISASQINICNGTSVTITASPSAGGPSPVFNFKVNGNSVQSGSSAVYVSSALNNNDVISCTLTSNSSCVSATTANSNSITMTVNATVIPTVSINSASGTTICAGTSVTFTAASGNGGSTPIYQWMKNGIDVGSNMNTYTDNGLINNDAINCVLASNATCANPDTVNSNSIIMTVNSCGPNKWLGLSTDWMSTSNWSFGTVPSGCADNVLVPSGLTVYPVLTSNIILGNVTLQGGASINLQGQTLSLCGNLTGGTGNAASIESSSGGKLILNGADSQLIAGSLNISELQIKNSKGVWLGNGAEVGISTALDLTQGNLDGTYGTLTFLSSDINHVGIIDNFSGGNSGTLSGNVVAQRYYASSETYNQHFMGSPVNNPALAQFGTSGTPGFVIPKTDCDESQMSSGSPYGTVFSYHENNGASCGEAQWKVETTGNAVNGLGYSVLKTGSGTLSLTGGPNLNTTYTLNNLSNSNWNNISLQNRQMSSGWQLLSNPYLATLNITTANPGFDNQIQVWNANGPYAGTYQPGTLGDDAIVAPFQAFMVHMTNTGSGGSYKINASDRVRTAASFFAVKDNVLNITAKNNNTNLLDQTTVAFNPEATDGFDPQFDADKFAGVLNRHTLYSINNGKWLSRNVLSSIKNSSSVPIGFEPGNSGDYTLMFNGINTFDQTTYITLEDKKLNVFYDVRNGDYNFKADSADNWDRFVLHFTPPAIVDISEASCNLPGFVKISQPGPASWSYTLADSHNSIITSGLLNDGNPVNINIQKGIYTLTLTDFNNYTVTKDIEVNGLNAAVAAFKISTGELNAESEIQFINKSQYANSLLWDFGDGTSETKDNPTHLYAKGGTYTVSLTAHDSTGCFSTTSQAIMVHELNTTVNSVAASGNLNMWSYENRVYIDFTALNSVNAIIRIYDILGREICNEKFTSNLIYQKEIRYTDAAYVLVNVINDGIIETRKLFIADTNK